MAPGQTLRWIESGLGPDIRDVGIEGTEPYIVGGHTASGYWVGPDRETTISGLFAAGDAAGGCPQKYVTGACAEAAIAAKAAARTVAGPDPVAGAEAGAAQEKKNWLEGFLRRPPGEISADGLEEEMQSVMDRYAGGISAGYSCGEHSLHIADERIADLYERLDGLSASGMQELVYILELRERLIVCRTLIAHMRARKETRWHTFCERADYPKMDPAFEKYVNSRLTDGRVETFTRELVRA